MVHGNRTRQLAGGVTQLLATRSVGPEGGPLVVLLHSIATSAALWEPQIAALSGQFRVLAVDLPGHGASPVPDTAGSMKDYARSVMATLVAHDARDCSVVGLSLGSSIAQLIAVLAPDRIRSVVLAGGTACPPPAVRDMWRTRAARARSDGMSSQAEEILGRWFTPAFAAAEPERVEAIRRAVLATPAEGYAQAAEAIADLDNRAMLSRIGCPALVVAGNADTAVPVEALQLIAHSIPNCRLATVDAAHLMNVEAAQQFTDLVTDHLVSSFAG